MTRTSVISHPPMMPVIVIRAEYQAICGMDDATAIVLNLFEHLTNIKTGSDTPNDLWVYKSVREMRADLLFAFSENTLAKAIDNLVTYGYLERRRNPRNKMDKTWQYRLCISVVQKHINAWFGALIKNAECNPQFCGVQSLKIRNALLKNGEAIPEDTTEDTSKETTKDSAPSESSTLLASPNVAATSAAQSEKQSVIDAEKIIVAAFDEPNDQQRLEQFYTSLKGKAPDDTTKAKIAECLKSYPYEQICDAIQFVHNAPQPKPGVMEVLERWEFEAAMDNPAKAAKPKAPKSSKGREPNPLYDALAQHLFGVSPHDKTAIKAINGRVVVLLPFAKEHVKPEELPLFVAWYRAKYPNLDLPRGTGTFAMKWTDFKAGGGNNVPVPIISQPSVPALAKAPIDSDFEAYVMRQRAKLKEEKPS